MTTRVDPGELRLPPSRRSGADPFKLADQVRRFGTGTDGMPPVRVTRGADGLMMINDGVTRASRVAKLSPGATILAEVIEERPNLSFGGLPRVRDTV